MPVQQMITRPNKWGIGIDVGWRIDPGIEVWWGNTRDKETLRSLIADARQRGYTFTLAEETAQRVKE